MRRIIVMATLATAAGVGTATAASALAQGPGDAAGDQGTRLVAGSEQGSPALKVVGLTADQRLVSFQTTAPGRVRDLGKVAGLAGDRTLVGIDYRVQNGTLYGVGDKGGIYTLRTSGTATKVSQLTVALQGTSFGVDFNPAANRLRVISDTGQNLRHNIDDPAGAPAAGVTAADGTLTNPPVPPAPAATATGVSGAAYTNNDLNANTATTLFDLDTTLDQVSVQSPANAGNLAPTGKFGSDAGPSAGFDIYSSAKAGTNTGYAALKVQGAQRFYQVNLLTGSVSPTGAFPAQRQVVDVALPLNQG
ncbi:DUF4394 domain-containing protein [Actinomadura macra]|uniref:DUF4394 domain-containing protein n=1 Tax=Actinomadura macra TaxID=46164 RepID=UPI000A9E650E|nr:DUF4394 domain-containing protein [Actinomadura macra]